MALRARKNSGAFEKRAPVLFLIECYYLMELCEACLQVNIDETKMSLGRLITVTQQK